MCRVPACYYINHYIKTKHVLPSVFFLFPVRCPSFFPPPPTSTQRHTPCCHTFPASPTSLPLFHFTSVFLHMQLLFLLVNYYSLDCYIVIFLVRQFFGPFINSFSSPSVFLFPCPARLPHTVHLHTLFTRSCFHLYVLFHRLSLSITFLFINDVLNILLSVHLNVTLFSCREVETWKREPISLIAAKLQLLCFEASLYFSKSKSRL